MADALLVSVMLPLIPVADGLTIIGPDHRGTGLSSPLGCDNQNSQNITTDCITYLTNRWTVQGLNQFSTTAAATDLAIQIQAAQLTGRISVLGASYGTYWLNRFLTIYPNLVQAAVMDSPVNPLLFSFSMYNARASSVAVEFLGYCHYQIECLQYFPDDPPAVMLYQILREMDLNQQNCINTYFTKYQLTSSTIRSIFFSMFQFAISYYDRTVIPAVIFRLNRCNNDDVAALDFFFKAQGLSSDSSNNSSQSNSNGSVPYSNALYYNIVFSELWLYSNQSEVDQLTLNVWQNATLIAPALNPDIIALRQAWPKYALDEYRYRLANSSVLMVSGQLDGATPLDFSSHLASITGKTRTFYSIPLSGDIIELFVTATGYTCPLQLILSWAFPSLFPSEWNDPTCLQNLPTTIDFVGATEMGRESLLKLLNTSLPFGNMNTSQTENRASSHYSITLVIFMLYSVYVGRAFSLI
jgi:pimeloyl-ACP methyl ester carboxylesterase